MRDFRRILLKVQSAAPQPSTPDHPRTCRARCDGCRPISATKLSGVLLKKLVTRVLSVEAISEPGNCDDELRIFWIVFDFVPQPKNVNVHSACQGRVAVSPDVLEQSAPGNRFTAILDEVTEQSR